MDKIKRKTLKAFTLIELITVVAIVAILTAIIVPNMMTSIRDSKMTAANDTAQQIHMAAQDYIVSLQLKGEKAEDYFGNNLVNSVNGMGFIEVVSKPGQDPQIVRNGVTSSGTGLDSNKVKAAAKGIESRMSYDLNGVWIVVVYAQTGTVKCVNFCDQSGTHSSGFDETSLRNVSLNPYTSMYNGNNNTCQEWDVRWGRKQYVGQYPIG